MGKRMLSPLCIYGNIYFPQDWLKVVGLSNDLRGKGSPTVQDLLLTAPNGSILHALSCCNALKNWDFKAPNLCFHQERVSSASYGCRNPCIFRSELWLLLHCPCSVGV